MNISNRIKPEEEQQGICYVKITPKQTRGVPKNIIFGTPLNVFKTSKLIAVLFYLSTKVL
jgi:hypothetical protein